MKKIAVYGGSFNPPLNSHFSFAEQIINENEDIEKIIFLPVSSRYNKKGLIEDYHRYNMLKLVCDKNNKFEVSDLEIKQEKQLHTYETLELIKELYPNYDICFITGTDNLKELSTWGTAEKLVNEYKFFILERDKDNMNEIIENDEFLKLYSNSFIKVNESIKSNICSTYVREKIKAGECARYLMPDEVYCYIKENNLYKI